MARFAFVQEELRDRFGFMTLAAILKPKGHYCEMFIQDSDDDLIKDVVAYKPDVIAFSTMTPGIEFAVMMARKYRELLPGVHIIMGGPHPTFYPEVIETHDCFDAICIGEGEEAIVEFVERIERKESYKDIANLHVRENGKIYKNEMRKLVDVDTVPYPDRGLYFDKYQALKEEKTKRIYLIRGCPFECTYCFNHAMKRMTKGKGKFLRQGSVERAIDEIKWMIETFDVTWLHIISDTLNVDKKWFSKFLEMYTQEIDLPFMVNLRLDFVDEEQVIMLKKAGCERADYAIEHGNELMRQKILKRPQTNESIIEIGNLFLKYGIRVHTANIIGVPHETVDTVLETIRLNQAVKPERAHVSILNPFSRTEIREYAVEHGFLDPETDTSNANFGFRVLIDKNDFGLVLKLDNAQQIMNLFYFFCWMVDYPKFERLFLFLSKFPTNRFYKFIYVWPFIKLDIRYASSFAERRKYATRMLRILATGNL